MVVLIPIELFQSIAPKAGWRAWLAEEGATIREASAKMRALFQADALETAVSAKDDQSLMQWAQELNELCETKSGDMLDQWGADDIFKHLAQPSKAELRLEFGQALLDWMNSKSKATELARLVTILADRKGPQQPVDAWRFVSFIAFLLDPVHCILIKPKQFDTALKQIKYAPKRPRDFGGEEYYKLCEYFRGLGAALTRKGVPIEDLIDVYLVMIRLAEAQAALKA
ncbi:MAG: hypothetical protein JWM80_2135 [Cyanobacteria bacterium RYN_339]|nr:hypothetical protein [Cyanobacteria bacterium RYN_339]